jgi:hypothetical protein
MAKTISRSKATANAVAAFYPSKQQQNFIKRMIRYALGQKGRLSKHDMAMAAYLINSNKRMTPAQHRAAIEQLFNTREAVSIQVVYKFRAKGREQGHVTPHDKTAKLTSTGSRAAKRTLTPTKVKRTK